MENSLESYIQLNRNNLKNLIELPEELLNRINSTYMEKKSIAGSKWVLTEALINKVSAFDIEVYLENDFKSDFDKAAQQTLNYLLQNNIIHDNTI